jgi:hypothetical protein
MLTKTMTIFLTTCFLLALGLMVGYMIGWINIAFLFVATLALCWHLWLLYIEAGLKETIKEESLAAHLPNGVATVDK